MGIHGVERKPKKKSFTSRVVKLVPKWFSDWVVDRLFITGEKKDHFSVSVKGKRLHCIFGLLPFLFLFPLLQQPKYQVLFLSLYIYIYRFLFFFS